jgi:hypothetical protein
MSSMSAHNLVTVFNFSESRRSSDAPPLATYKATRETIVERLKGTVLEGTGEEVSEDELDAQGRYRRIASGWGELG